MITMAQKLGIPVKREHFAKPGSGAQFKRHSSHGTVFGDTYHPSCWAVPAYLADEDFWELCTGGKENDPKLKTNIFEKKYFRAECWNE